jgi:putative component of membrane protein insertase Oxa1/YidC/SpoIIIJ protein YidD
MALTLPYLEKYVTVPLAIGAVKFYQIFLQPFLKMLLITTTGHYSACKHSPTCSQYTILQIRKHGTITGLKNGIIRIWNCR